MHIHIVCTEFSSDQILARLVRDLLHTEDWTAGEYPDPSADVNYFFPYLNYKSVNTLTAAWFTHKDIGRSEKEQRWENVARNVSLRLTSAPLYLSELETYGTSALVTPPLDRKRFKPGALTHHPRPVVGVSGYVYPQGRKGEHLVRQLMDSRFGRQLDIRGMGSGWPCPTRTYPWKDVPTFYHGLDVYLCTASIEGVPYPPLEALACGIPVVIPYGVGLLDTLPEMDGITRYEAGNYADMERALMQALDNRSEVNAQALRDTMQRFTLRTWLEDHRAAFETLLEPESEPVIESLPDWRGNSGVYYVAYGNAARECVQKAIASVHYHMPGLPVALVSDTPIGAEDVFIQHPDTDIGARSVKTQIYDLAPQTWQYVAYLDADTELVGDIGFLFQLLQDGWDMAICTNPAQYVEISNGIRPDNHDEMDETIGLLGTGELIQPNGGVFSFRRNERTATLIRGWHEAWQKYGKRDQAALDRVLYTHPVKLYLLSAPWNCVTRYLTPDEHTAIVHHPLQARRWKGVIQGRLDSGEAWAALHPGGNE